MQKFKSGTEDCFITLFKVLKLCMLMKEGRFLHPTSFSYSHMPHSEQISLNFFIVDKFLQHQEQALMRHSQGGK